MKIKPVFVPNDKFIVDFIERISKKKPESLILIHSNIFLSLLNNKNIPHDFKDDMPMHIFTFGDKQLSLTYLTYTELLQVNFLTDTIPNQYKYMCANDPEHIFILKSRK